MTHRRALNVIALFLVCVTIASAQSMWEGTAVVGRYGDFPPDGLFVASASFAVNSVVDVTNLNTGRSARLVVVRQASDPGILMVLSSAAAGQLGFGTTQTAMVRARLVAVAGLTAVDPNRDLPFHPDPDINPSAALGDPNAALIMPRDGAPGMRYDPDSFSATPLAGPAIAPPTTPTLSTTSSLAIAPSSAPVVDAAVTEASVAVAPIAPVISPIPTPPMTVIEAHETPLDGPDTDTDTDTDPDPDLSVPVPAAAVASIIAAPETPEVVPDPPTVETPVVGAAPEPVADAPPQAPDPVPAPAEPPPPLIGGVAIAVSPRDGELPAQALDAEDVVEPVLWWHGPEPSTDLVMALPFPDDSEARLAEALVQPTLPFDQLPPDGLALVEPVDLPIVEDLTIDPPTELTASLIATHMPAMAGAPEEPLEAPMGSTEAPPTVAIAPPPEPESAADAGVVPRRPAHIPDDALIVLEPAEPRAPPVSEVPAEEPSAVAMTEPEPADVGEVEPTVASVPPTAPISAPTPAPEPEPEPEPAQPAVPSPAIVTATPEATAVPRAPVPRGLPIVQWLEPGAVYLQVVAVGSEQSARQTVDSLGAMFPVAVMEQRSAESERAVYRVMVGPLDEDEKGSVLHWVRNRGYRDAFIRRADPTTASR